jgi:hypothetical protein
MALPQTEDEMQALLTGALAEAFAPLGFTRVALDPRGEAWDSLLRRNALGTQYMRPFVWQRDDGIGYTCDIWLEIRDTRVEQVIRKFTPDEANMPTATLKFSRFVSESDLVVDSPAGLKTFVAKAKELFAELLPKTADMAQLDGLVNGEREEVDFLRMLESYAPFVIAFLGRNPRFDNMVIRGDKRITPDPDDPVSKLMRIAVYLHTSVRVD